MPFTTGQFFDVFASYNEAVFPVQVILLVAALVSIRLASIGDGLASKSVALVLGFLWLWTGVVYHWIFFSPINGAAIVFGAFFVLQAVIVLYAGAIKTHLSFGAGSGLASIAGTLMIVYALLVYPLFGIALGHEFPYSPTFGLPCPTTIFTFGLLLRSGRSIPLYVLPIPFAWALLGTSAAYSFGVWQDLGLFVSGVATTAIVMGARIRSALSHSSEITPHPGTGLRHL